MALSPNYGFPEPDNASLVKNGAQDIRALGDSIDSFLFRPFGANPILNSAFQVWQRGTSFTGITANNTYTADRWTTGTSGTFDAYVSRQTTSDTTNLPNIQYCARVGRTSGNTSTSGITFIQSMESSASIPYAGKTVTMSFYARAGANYSAASNALTVYLLTGTGTDQSGQGAISGGAFPINSTATLTTTWQRFTFTGTVAATATQLFPYLLFTPVGTAGANDYFEITGIQIEVGNKATPFKTNQPTLATELAACQRYYEQVSNSDVTSGGNFCVGYANSTTDARFVLQYLIPKRATPSITFTGNFFVQNVTNLTVTATGTYAIGTRNLWFFGTTAGMVLNSAVAFIDNGGIIKISAEL
jgi:hypothetical protein